MSPVPLRPVNLMNTKVTVKDVEKPLTLHCSAFGDPIPNITWHKDGKLLKSNTTVIQPKPDQLPLYRSELVIDQISSKDEGKYSCKMETSMIASPVQYDTEVSK